MLFSKLTIKKREITARLPIISSEQALKNLSLLYSKQCCWECEGKRKPHGFTWGKRKLPDRGVQSKSAALPDGLSKDPTLLQSFSTRKTFIRDTPGCAAGRTMEKIDGRSWRQSTPKSGNLKSPQGTNLCVPSLRHQVRKMCITPSWYWAFLNPGQNFP